MGPQFLVPRILVPCIIKDQRLSARLQHALFPGPFTEYQLTHLKDLRRVFVGSQDLEAPLNLRNLGLTVQCPGGTIYTRDSAFHAGELDCRPT